MLLRLTAYTVVLGGDSAHGLALVLELEKQGYIVITSVSAPEAVDEIESQCHGYVRALVLDPTEVRPSFTCYNKHMLTLQ